MRYSLNPDERTIEELRALGFTAANAVPYGGMLPGNGAIVLLGAENMTDPLVRVPKSALYSTLTGGERVYPNTVIGVLAKWRELYRQASLAKGYETTYASNRSGIGHPETSRILEAFYPVMNKRQPVLFRAENILTHSAYLHSRQTWDFRLFWAI